MDKIRGVDKVYSSVYFLYILHWSINDMIRYDYSTGDYLTLPATFHEDGTLTA